MEKKSIGLIATIGTTLLCACPGLCLMIFGIGAAFGEGTYQSFNAPTPIPPAIGLGLLCFGSLFLLIPLGVGIYTIVLYRKDKSVIENLDAPIPPAI